MGSKVSQLEWRIDDIASMDERSGNVAHLAAANARRMERAVDPKMQTNVSRHGTGDSHRHRSPSRTSGSSDTDISALRPRSVSAERPPSALRQQLRATEAE